VRVKWVVSAGGRAVGVGACTCHVEPAWNAWRLMEDSWVQTSIHLHIHSRNVCVCANSSLQCTQGARGGSYGYAPSRYQYHTQLHSLALEIDCAPLVFMHAKRTPLPCTHAPDLRSRALFW
jgi:hypothetical protein